MDIKKALKFAIAAHSGAMEDKASLARDLAAANSEIETLRELAADLMALLDQMPVKHPQQAGRRAKLRRKFDAIIRGSNN